MDNASTNEPTVEELVAKALRANVIDQEFAGDLRSSADLEEALGMFYTYALEQGDGDDPEALLRGWGIIEQGDEPVSNRLLYKGMDTSYADLVSQLREGEMLIATWLRTPANFPKIQLVVDQDDHRIIVSGAKAGYGIKLCWFASTTGSENPIDYGMFG